MSTPNFEQRPEQSADGADAPAAASEQALLQELATSIAFLPQDGLADGESHPDGSIAIPVIEQDGTQYVPVFTSEEALRSAGAAPSPPWDCRWQSSPPTGRPKSCGWRSTRGVRTG